MIKLVWDSENIKGSISESAFDWVKTLKPSSHMHSEMADNNIDIVSSTSSLCSKPGNDKIGEYKKYTDSLTCHRWDPLYLYVLIVW